MTFRVDLIWIGHGSEPPSWPIGDVVRCEGTPEAVSRTVAAGATVSRAAAWLFWDSALSAPAASRVAELLSQPGDIWHAGLALGLAGRPGIIDFITPTWTFNRDPDPKVEATSWRISLRACLVRTDVLRWAPPSPEFQSLAAAALDWGYRCIRFGALPRHVPSLLSTVQGRSESEISLADELVFVKRNFGRHWFWWTLFRALATGYARLEELGDAVLAIPTSTASLPPLAYVGPHDDSAAPVPTVTVLIPTLSRYSYLRTVLGQLRHQSARPCEVIVVDQTPRPERASDLQAEFPDLPLRVLTLETAGQSTARNAGLRTAVGDAVLFLDDDDEIDGDLIEKHLRHLRTARADVSSGIANEPKSGPVPEAFRRHRVSDVFPTNNTLVTRGALLRSGLFDLAYDRGARADGDLGMRVYLAGAVMMMNPEIRVLHHHAPKGGLREHGARVVTYAGSRSRVTQRQLPELTEIYRTLRYFSERQLRESLWQRAMGTLSAHGDRRQKFAKAVFGLLTLPDTVVRIRNTLARAREMLSQYPQIPTLESRGR